MKTPYLDQHQRFILKLNRENKIWTPGFIVRHELLVACRKFVRKINVLWVMLVLFLAVLILMMGCVTPLEQRVPKCVIVDKHKNFFKGYSFESVLDSNYYYITVSKKEFDKYQIGDTIKK